ncbi:MAG: DNA repair protein RadA [Candidatus Gracilibacteria bacterium]|nr:DNA repair protein RadA [Candidatus Gracilibacteria bacterium]
MYICNNCGNEAVKWAGQCSFCKEWNSLVEFKETKLNSKTSGIKKDLIKINNDLPKNQDKIITKSNELNNLLGGGITVGSIILLSGEPGIGKSTLALQLGNLIDGNIIYISAEENENQIFSRAKRLAINSDNISLLCESNLENILQTLKNTKSDLIVLDSISVITSNNINGTAGSISQVKEIAEKIVDFGKTTNTVIVLIGHVNKDGNLAGPKTLEHLVDTVLYFEGERYEDIRILRSLKNRFGSTGEIAIFKMGESGLADLSNPGLEFISSENDDKTIGSSLSITMEGSRPIVVEIESLTTYTKFGYPKRSARGIATQKLDLILAVLGKYSKVNLDSYDVYVNIVRGIKVDEPGIDLSIGASIISSKLNKSISRNTIFIGEISLTGRIKNCFSIEKRIKEAIKLGFENIIIPDIDIKIKEKVNIIKIKNIGDLVEKIN